MVKEKSRGIKILGWIIAILALNNFITYIICFYLFARGGYAPMFIRNYAGVFSYFEYLYLHQLFAKYKLFFLCNISTALPFIYNILFLVSAIGIMKFKNWARKLVVICLILLLVLVCISFCYKFTEINTFGKFLYLFKTLILLFPIVYLTRPKVREQFRANSSVS